MEIIQEEVAPKGVKKRRFTLFRASLVCFVVFTLLCGLAYPLSVTLAAQTAFPYEANGSQIIVTMPDGAKTVYGSELIGQSYESAEYLFGRVNTGAPTNLSPESEEYKKLVEERIAQRREKLAAVGYTDREDIPAELVTSGGSGVDPHISTEAAYFQIPAVTAARNAKAAEGEKISEAEVKETDRPIYRGPFFMDFRGKTGKRPAGQSFFGRVNLTCKRAN